MKKSYIQCPYCQKEVSVSGSSMHVKNMHTEKYEEFKSKFVELKKQAIVKESTTRTPIKPAEEPPRIEDKPEDKPRYANDAGHVHEIKKDTSEDKQTKPLEDKHPARGDDKPPQGKSFLGDLDKWLDSSEF